MLTKAGEDQLRKARKSSKKIKHVEFDCMKVCVEPGGNLTVVYYMDGVMVSQKHTTLNIQHLAEGHALSVSGLSGQLKVTVTKEKYIESD